MCTLIVSFRQHFEVPVVVAANRDEVRSRPATGPRRWQDEAFVAPRDEQAQGTWLGLTATGLFVGVTNRFPAERYPDRRSRGALVVDALRSPSASALHRELGRKSIPGRTTRFTCSTPTPPPPSSRGATERCCLRRCSSLGSTW